MNDRVLFVDDESGILGAVRRVFMDAPITVLTSSSPVDALDVIRGGGLSAIVSDNMMPGMRGIELLEKAKNVSPESVRILMTGRADLQSAVDAINRGEVFRFIMKPWDDLELKEAVFEAVERHRTVKILRHADEATLRSIAQMTELKDPYTMGHCDRVADMAVLLAGPFELDDETIRGIRHGAWLHDCGKIGVPERILNHPGPLEAGMMHVIKKHPQWGAEVARQAMLPQTVVNIILHHHERFDGKGYPSGLSGESIPLEARIVAAADIYDALTSDRSYRKAHDRKKAPAIVSEMTGNILDPAVAHLLDPLTGIKDDRR